MGCGSRARAGRAPLRGARAVVFGLVAALGALTVPAPSSAAQEDPAADQRVVKLRADYRIEPDQGEVQVVEEITVSNVRGSTRSGSVVTSYFWTGHTIWTPADAEDLSIAVEGEPLVFEVVETIQGVDIISADYRRNLEFGQTRVIDVTYTLPTYPPGEGDRRINDAFFDLELLICCNFEEVDLTVSIPSSFEVDVPINLPFEPRSAGARQEYVFTESEEQSGQFTELILTDWYGLDEAGFAATPFPVGPGTVEIVAPPDDAAWSTDTSTLVGDVAAELEALTGSPATLDGAQFRQGLDTNFDRWGSDGPFDEPIVVPRDYDEAALAITVAKAWLRDGPFDDIDIERGLAADLGTEALRRVTGTETDPTEPTGGGLTDLVSDERAFWVVRQLSDELGYDSLRALLGMAANGETAYVGDAEPEQNVTIPNDWRRFVDLAEQRLGSEIIADLAAQHLVDDVEAAALTTRNETVADYERLVERADGVAPLGIRNHLTNWEFAEAEPLLTRASSVLDERDRVAALAESKGEDPAVPLGELWAGAVSVDDLDAVEAQILQRESDLNSSGLLRNALIGLGALLLVGAAAGGALLLSRRNKQATPATVGGLDPSLSGLPAPPPGFGGGPPAPAPPATAPPSSTGPVDPATLPAPPAGATIDVANLPPPGTPAGIDLTSFPAPMGAPTSPAVDPGPAPEPGAAVEGGPTADPGAAPEAPTVAATGEAEQEPSSPESADASDDAGPGEPPVERAARTVVVDRPDGPPDQSAPDPAGQE